ncbi:hypothetical protein JCM3765_007059 [Sporobolomyces pararoseus]
MSYEGQDHHPHKRGYPPCSDLLLSSPLSIPPNLELVQAHWFVRHGERAPVRQRMVGLGDIPAIFQLCSIGRQFTSAVLTLSPVSSQSSQSSSEFKSSLSNSSSSSNPFLSTTRHTTSFFSSPSSSSTTTASHDAPISQTHHQLPVTRFTQQVYNNRDGEERGDSSVVPKRGGLKDCYWGELTDLGRESTLRFGSILRKLYTSFLPSELNSKMFEQGVIEFRSTNMPRTIESLHQIIEGLYPSSSSSSSDDNLRIPFMVRNWTEESLTPNTTSCRKLRKLDLLSIKRVTLEQNSSLAQLDELFKPLFGEGNKIRIDSNPRASGILDTLMVCRAHGIKVPKVLQDPKVLTVLENAVVHEWFDGYKNLEFKRLAMGRLFSDLHNQLSLKVNHPEKEKLKLSINSCHDTSVAGIMNALDVFNGRWPAFTANIGIELYASKSKDLQSTSSPPTSSPSSSSSSSSSATTTTTPPPPPPDHHFVRVLYNGKTLSLPGCQEPRNHLEGSQGKICTFKAFSKILEKVEMREKEWREVCSQE